ncbi:sulfotransferase 1B1-like [Mytilus galloprovincialis]|uniref:sulfotransferase 1B1-like n=1 Tax=Mytilus galloprovincialis TaxID=29158 RepID=UPI003F7C8F9E
MSSDRTDGLFPVRRYQYKNGDLEIDNPCVDKIALHPFMTFWGDNSKIAERLQSIRNMELKEDDILIAAYPKCGTHWVWEIVSMLMKGKADYQRDIKEELMIEGKIDLSSVSRSESSRILNTHFPYRFLPRKLIENGGKIIHVTRNPKDMYVSLYHHAINSGLFGPKCENLTWNQYFSDYVFGEVQFYGTWFAYEREMSRAKKENNNILTVHFEKLKSDPATEIHRIADFLNIHVTDNLVKDIVNKCDFKNLKKADKDVKTMGHEMKVLLESSTKENPSIKLPEIYRKGSVADWKNHFTVAQNEKFDALIETEMKDIDLDVFYEITTT